MAHLGIALETLLRKNGDIRSATIQEWEKPSSPVADRMPLDGNDTFSSQERIAETGASYFAPRSLVQTGRLARRSIPVQTMDAFGTGLELVALALSAWVVAKILPGVSSSGTAALFRPTLLSLFFYVVASHGLGGRSPADRFSYPEASVRSVVMWTLVITFLCLMGILLRAQIAVPGRWILAFAALGCVILPGVRIVWVAAARWLRRAGAFDRRCAIIGSLHHVEEVAAYVAAHPWLTVSICGLYDDLANTADRGRSSGFCGGLSDLVAAIRQGRVDQVMIALPASVAKRIATVVEALALTPTCVRRAFDLAPSAGAGSRMVLLGDLPLMTLSDRPLAGLSGAIKIVADRVVGLALLLALGPIFLCVAAAIRLDTPGPIFFRQLREGFNCRPFRIWKFRTMYDRDASPGALVQACRGDPRITRVGRFLRRSSIDELPQLINVVLGQMSLVGPRPHALSTRAGGIPFGEISQTYPARHRVKPGITGWAQVRGLRGETDTPEKLIRRLDHDLFYCDHWSVAFDFQILFLTIFTVPFDKDAF